MKKNSVKTIFIATIVFMLLGISSSFSTIKVYATSYNSNLVVNGYGSTLANVEVPNEPPTISISAYTPTVTTSNSETTLFNCTSISTVEANQHINNIVLQVDGLQDGPNEILQIDGSDISLGNVSGTTLNNFTYSVSVSGGEATVVISKDGCTSGEVQHLINGLKYNNSSSNYTHGNRTVTLSSIQDDGGTGNGGCDTTPVGSSSTITVISKPGAPTIATATAGDRQAIVSFTTSDNGGSEITGYTVTATPLGGTTITETGSSSPITVTGLTNGTGYAFTVTATNSAGTGPASTVSNPVTPVQPTEITSFDLIQSISAGTAGSATYANVSAVIAALPGSVTANGNTVTIPVSTWVDTDNYHSDVAGSYTFTATLGTIPSGYANNGNYIASVEVIVTAPTAVVLSAGSVSGAIVGNGTITGLDSVKSYNVQIMSGSDNGKYVDGTGNILLTAVPITGVTSITGLFNGTTYKVIDVTPNNSSISPISTSFDKYLGSSNYQDIQVNMTLNGNTLSSIKNGATTLTEGTDYTIDNANNKVIISKTYLANQAVGTTNLTFNFNGGNSQTLAITITYTVPYTPPYIPPTPVQQNVPVPVEIGTGEKKSTVNINAIRALDTDGLEKATLKLDEDTCKKIVANAIDAKSNEADIVLPTDTQYSNDKIDIQLPKESITEFSSSNISLNISKGMAALELPSQTLEALKDKDAEIEIKQLADSNQIAETKSLILQLTSGGQSVSTPVSIETNFSGRAKITLPIDVSKFTNKDDLNKYLSSLAVIVQHSDGENAVDKGTIEYDTNGNPIGISIWVNKFSDFTLVQLPEDYFKGKTTVMKDKVESDKEWHLKFTMAADPATVTSDNIYVTDSKGNKVDVKVSCESDDVIKVSPVNPYKSGESYYIYISKKVTSKYKEPLTEDLRYEFTVK
jgi:mRNA-degrading endonuclease toxin of MazEF toxin-antitoxin module